MPQYSPSRCCCPPRCRGICGEIPAPRLWFGTSRFDPVELKPLRRRPYPRLFPSNRDRDSTYCVYGFAGTVDMPGSAIIAPGPMPLLVQVRPVVGLDDDGAPYRLWRVNYATAGRVPGYADNTTACPGQTISGYQAVPPGWGQYSTGDDGDWYNPYRYLSTEPNPPGQVPARSLGFFDALCPGDPTPYFEDESTPRQKRRFVNGTIAFTNTNPPPVIFPGITVRHELYYLFGGTGCPGTGAANAITTSYFLTLNDPT